MGKVFFEAEDVRHVFSPEDFAMIDRLDENSQPVKVHGVRVYGDEALASRNQDELAMINLGQIYGEHKIGTLDGDKHRLYIYSGGRFDILPRWLNGVPVHCEESGDYEADVDLNASIFTTRIHKGGQMVTEFDIACNDPVVTRQFSRFLHLLSQAKRCSKCGQILTTASGDIDTDPTRTTCLWECKIDAKIEISA